MPLIVTPRQLIQRAELYHQLASLMSAGVGLIQALEMVRRNPPSHSFREPLARLIASITEGTTLTESMLSLTRWLPSFDLALIQAGEKSGRLPESFRLLASYYNERAQLGRRVLADLAYPLFVLHFAIFIFPVSRLVQLVSNFDVVAFFWAKFILLAPAYVVILLLLVACQGHRGEHWRANVEGALRWIPMLGPARRHLALARLSAALEALIGAGVSIFDSWELAAAASGSPALRRAVHGWHEALRSGETPAELVGRTSEFPELFANLYHTGEVSGQLDDSLRRLHQVYQEEGSRKLHTFAQWMPRLIYLAILLAVAYQIVSFYAGYFDNMRRELNF